jgi:threonine dehydrogenase-like Zn-dependent dehydrogenase
MLERVLAATTIGASKTEIREYPIPAAPPDGGILRVAAARICDSDWQACHADRPARIMCHDMRGAVQGTALLWN